MRITLLTSSMLAGILATTVAMAATVLDWKVQGSDTIGTTFGNVELTLASTLGSSPEVPTDAAGDITIDGTHYVITGINTTSGASNLVYSFSYPYYGNVVTENSLDLTTSGGDLYFAAMDINYTVMTGLNTPPGGEQVTISPGGVPEPATWTLMILGVGAVGGALRFRRQHRSLGNTLAV